MATPINRIDDPLSLSERFIQHGLILRGWSAETVSTYRKSFRECPQEITTATLNAAVVAMRERGLTPGGINLRLRSINSFLTWLHEEGHIREPLRVKLLKNPPKPIQINLRQTSTESDQAQLQGLATSTSSASRTIRAGCAISVSQGARLPRR